MSPGETRSPEDEAGEAEQHVAQLLRDAQARAVERGTVPEPRKGSAKARRPGSLRHIADVIVERELYDLAVSPVDGPDHNPVDQALRGKSSRVANVPLVLAIAHACHHIAGDVFGEAEAATYTRAAQRADTLRRKAEAAAKERGRGEAPDQPPPAVEPAVRPRSRRRTQLVALVVVAAVSAAVTLWAVSARDSDSDPSGAPESPAATTPHLSPAADGTAGVLSCQDGVPDAGIVEQPATLFNDTQATMIQPTLDFDTMNGSARYLSHQGRKYYWGRAGSDDHDPYSGGVRLLWRLEGETSWHECRKALPKEERDYVRTAAVPTTINNRAVVIKVCLWRDEPYRENCTAEQ